MVLLPAMGIVAEIITVFSRKKLFAYKTVLYTMFGTGVLSFTVWAHHQFVAGIDPAHGEHLHGHDAAHLGADRRDVLRLHRHALRRLDHAHHADAVGARLPRRVPDRRRDGHLPGRERLGHLPARHLLRAGALPLHVLPDRDHRDLRGHHLLVPEDVRADDERDAREDPLLGHDHLLQRDLHPALRDRRGGRSSAHLRLLRTSPSWRPSSRTCACSRPSRWS